MNGKMTADELRTHLELEPNTTCGFVHLTYVSSNGAVPR
jgi:hypothetical protein